MPTVTQTPTDAEKLGFARFARAAYATGRNALGHKASALAALPSGAECDPAQFSAVMSAYCTWLSLGEWPDTPDFSDMTETLLRKWDAKADAARSALCDEMIAAGRGHELHSETMERSKRADADSLSIRFADASRLCGWIADEKRRRMEYHGSLKRIASRAA